MMWKSGHSQIQRMYLYKQKVKSSPCGSVSEEADWTQWFTSTNFTWKILRINMYTGWEDEN